ncbi:MAG TPA: 16S rRNA (cytidine(1402)-2'-O)-methyltransferase [Burkholderiales bacterium]|nr:16S rRNA (cytidine(1402)-2'-O)-methyltransferase [Burkholderiales bacterium]
MGNAAAHPESARESKPTLYVVATPIGNLRDVSLRALDVLKSVDIVAAEDTRVTARLLNHYGIANKLIALHEHNEKRMVRQVLDLLAAGRPVALVSDAGTPAVSDPGAQLVAAVIDAGYRVMPVPGANAAVTALSAAGLAAPHFLFYGFLPARAAERKRELAKLGSLPYALVFYEAPHRVVDSIADLRAAFGDARRIVIARELTKLYETIHACTLAEASIWIEKSADHRKGEFVLILDSPVATHTGEEAGQAQRVLEILLAELPLKQAVALTMKITGSRKNELYRLALALRGEQ